MASQIVMPQMGYDMKEGRVIRWIKQEGDKVTRGEAIAEIETDKATIEMEAYASGVLGKIQVPEGETVLVGRVLGFITAPGETIPAELLEAVIYSDSSEEQPMEGTVAPKETVAAPEARTDGQVRSSPLARRLAKERGVDLKLVSGTGPSGRITEKDIVAYAEKMKQSPKVTEPTRFPDQAPNMVELSRMRQAIARLTSRAKREIPHFYVTADIDMTLALEFRQNLNRDQEQQTGRVSVNDLLVKACAMALVKYPIFNCSFREDKLEMHPFINIGIAVALENEGLIVPAVLDCGSKSLGELARATRDLVERAHQRHLKEHEYTDATFSISNLGMFDIESFVAIIHPPQSAVLSLGSVRKQAVVRGDQIVIAEMLKGTLATDHRVADGAQAARFLIEIKTLLEHPLSLMA